MNLRAYLKKNKLTALEFARMHDFNSAIVYRSCDGSKRISPIQAEKIERCTNGEVSRSEAIWRDICFENKSYNKVFVANDSRNESNFVKLTYAEYGLFITVLDRESMSLIDLYSCFSDLEQNVNITVESLIKKGFLFEKEEEEENKEIPSGTV